MGWIEDVRNRTNFEVFPEDELVEAPVIGEKYHLSWAMNRGMVWKLVAFNDRKAILTTPRTGKRLITSRKSLREVNRNIIKKVKFRNRKL